MAPNPEENSGGIMFKSLATVIVTAGILLSSCSDTSDVPSGSGTPGDSALAALDLQAELLLRNVGRARDIADIERLQNAYGYYIDRSEWDEVVDLLTDDATAEYGVAGVYRGKEQIRGLLYGVGYGERGLQPQQLREHMQIQPVITLSPDGLTARARWKGLVLLGQYEEYARWQTGPYENEYRKEDGVWKISKLHWKETFTVPFEGGWAARMEGTNVDDRIFPAPDAPPSRPYQPWPATDLLPFHFDNPVSSTLPAPQAPPAPAAAASAEAIQAKLALATAQAQRLEDERDIEILQRTYGYFVDKNLWDDIGNLFAEDGTLEIGGRGIFVGRERAVEYLKWLGDPVQGRLYDHTQMQGIVHVSEDGNTARGRWRALVFGGDVNRSSVFGDCIYENEYVKIDGVWQIKRLHAYFIMYTMLDQGWQTLAWPNTRPETELPPDLPPTVVYDMYPGTLTAPYHYDNPVTGRSLEVEPLVNSDATPSEPAAMAETASALASRIANLQDGQAVERLQNIMGYYFDARDWDNIVTLFSDDGRFERDQRGVYQGPQSIRRALNLFGEPGVHQRNVHEHYLYQHIIHVDESGTSARARFRSLDMLGDFGGEALLGGSVFENDYVKEDGVWKISSDRQYTTFLADYDLGWSHGAMAVPGVSTEVPPDAPPSFEYEAFPNYYLFPFHYAHPVTGEVIVPAAE